jgi:hypothetical protein
VAPRKLERLLVEDVLPVDAGVDEEIGDELGEAVHLVTGSDSGARPLVAAASLRLLVGLLLARAPAKSNSRRHALIEIVRLPDHAALPPSPGSARMYGRPDRAESRKSSPCPV